MHRDAQKFKLFCSICLKLAMSAFPVPIFSILLYNSAHGEMYAINNEYSGLF